MNNEEANAISKASYMAGVLDERSQWYKKINEKIEILEKELKEELDNLGFGINIVRAISALEELIGKEE